MKTSIRTLSAARLFGLILLALASFVLILALDPGQSIAAPGEQDSPLPSATATGSVRDVSPLETPTSTATPTATSPIPPTAEPPANIQSWPTPAPTPYPLPVQASIDLLANDTTLAVADPELSVRILVDDPATGDELTIVRLRDPATGSDYWLRADSDGNAAILPDLGEAALAHVAEAAEAAIADLSLSRGRYYTFPFTRQILWSGRIINAKDNSQINLAFDLAGEEADLEAATEAEADAVSQYCGFMDIFLCLEILYAAPSDESNVLLVYDEESGPESLIAFLDEQQTTYRQDDDSLYFRMENDLLRELAQLENIDRLQKDFPDEVRPLDTNLVIGLIEESGALSLTLETQKEYPLLTYQVSVTLETVEITQTQSVTLLAHIDGIFTPVTGPSSLSPATARLALGELSGRYNLALAYTDPERELDLLDNYLLIVSNGRAVIRGDEPVFTWPKYTTWLRLPSNAIWFVVHARSTDAEGKAIELDLDDFADKADAFYADVVDVRAQDLRLSEGIYTNDLFVPPWETWQIPDGDMVQIPVNESQSYLFKWPDIRYFTYNGQLSTIEATIAEHCVDEVSIVGYTANGDVLDVCEPQ